MVLVKARFISTVLILIGPRVLATNTNDVQPEGRDGCNIGFSGPDCDIPYESCPDKHRKCFNNSRCVKNNKKNSYTGHYDYHCDCSYASGVSSYAGHECEHSSTIICGDSFIGDHFCTNGGECGTYFLDAIEHTGCHCPEDFEGAHCQYIIGTMDGNLLGETLLPKYGANFYGFAPENTPKRRASAFATGLISFVLLACVTVTAAYTFKKKRESSEVITDNKRQYSCRTVSPKVDDTCQLLDQGGGDII